MQRPLRFLAILFLGVLPVLPSPSSAKPLDGKLLEGLSARSLGPAAVGGRIAAIAVQPGDPEEIFVGAATGGVWQSTNGGLTWEPIFDEEAVASIGALAIDPTNPDVLWVGTGEDNVRNSTSVGRGIYKSLDRGESWRLMGLEDTERIRRIAIHPRNPDRVYVAALGPLWGDGEDRGIYRTADGGESWEKILYVDEKTGGTEVVMAPDNPDKLYAALWEHRRWPYLFESGGPGSGIYVSHDGGDTWKRRTREDGLPEGDLGRITFGVSPADPDRVYALVEAEESALIRSDDGGESWETVNEAHDVADRPFYYTLLAVDPTNADRVYNIATRLRVSIDGGETFEYNPVIDCCEPGNTVHIDNHALWIDPEDPTHLIIGNDGGLAISHDRGATWRFVRNLPLAQFYHVAVDDAHPYHVYGGLQDNGSWRGPAEIWQAGDIRNLHWQEVGFGDGFDTVPDPENPRRGYSMAQGGYLFRWNLETGEIRTIRPAPPSPDVELRFNWNAGFAQDPFDPDTIYYGSQFLHRSTDRGESWAVISPDLTTNDPEVQKYKESGGLTPDVTAAENYTTIVAVAPSPVEEGTLWVGTDDGRVHVTRDGGESWDRVDHGARGVPDRAWVPMIDPSPHDAGSAHVVFDDHRRNDMETYVYRAEEYGERWRSLATDELSGYALSVRQDPVDPDLLFLGTELGLFVSVDAGTSWTKFTAGVPTVSVMDLAIQARESDLVLGTHGRGIYVIDDYSALRDLSPADFDSRLEILAVTEGQQYVPEPTASTRFTASGEFRAENEPYGVLVTFTASGEELPHPDEELERARLIRKPQEAAAEAGLEEDVQDDEDEKPKVELTVRDGDGEVIRTYRHPVHKGINRIVWGLVRDGVPPMPGSEAEETEDGLPAGPAVPPGEYELTLTLGDAEASTTVEVVADPRSPYSLEDQRANHALQLELLAMQRAAVQAVERIVHAREDVDTVLAILEKRHDVEEEPELKPLEKRAKTVKEDLTGLEKQFRVPPETTGIVYDEDKVVTRIGLARASVASTLDAPSPSARTYVELARRSLVEPLEELNRFLNEELRAFAEAVEEAEIGLLAPGKPVEVE